MFSKIVVGLKSLVFFLLVIGGSIVLLRFAPSSPTGKASPTVEQHEPEGRRADIALSMVRPNRVDPGFTLIPVEGTAEILLVNMSGKVVHKWNLDAIRARMLPNGNILVVHGTKWGLTQEKWRSLRGKIREYDPQHKVVWEYSPELIPHHDVQRLASGNTLLLLRDSVPAKYKSMLYDSLRRTSEIRSDTIMEIDSKGGVVWRWSFHDHLDIRDCGKAPCARTTGEVTAAHLRMDWTHTNTISPIPENRWFDNGDTRFRPGNLVVVPRNWSTILVVDKLSGEVAWRYHGDLNGGLGHPHEAYMIPKGLPGAGNIMVFDNGSKDGHNGETYILEVNPTSSSVEWSYNKGKDFFCPASGAAQRLENGNTLISHDRDGFVFEVDRSGDTVWKVDVTNARVRRASRYRADHAPFLSKLPVFNESVG